MPFSLADMLARIPALLIALSFHEYAHARMAYAWGDPTAKYEGRLTLNPLAHLDPMGLLMLLVVRFGWAKPVPINPFYFKDRRKGLFWVSLAGPGMNLLLGLVATFLWVLIRGSGYFIVDNILYYLVIYNVFLAIFNIIPLPPLDGSKILSSLLPTHLLYYYQAIEPYGPFLLIFLLFFGRLPYLLVPVANAIINLYTTLVLFLVKPLLPLFF
ncbi:MAG: site-2 protease family protein [Firmicutes bacterium]|nr:site-2 protease family protein [Bacillota bacterium]